MEIFIETERLILRELLPTDDKGMFELDSNKVVHEFLEKKPLNNIEQSRKIIEFIRQQYFDNGIGRWAIIEKETDNFMGWTGLKLIKDEINHHSNFYDLGYRLIPKFWGKGFATESAIASLNYGFENLKLNEIYGMCHINNIASRMVLEKTGLKCIETFYLDGEEHNWLKATRKI
ncbi:MAG TPA: GNAT family N-acetyltransferase [Hanamia sp.]